MLSIVFIHIVGPSFIFNISRSSGLDFPAKRSCSPVRGTRRAPRHASVAGFDSPPCRSEKGSGRQRHQPPRGRGPRARCAISPGHTSPVTSPARWRPSARLNLLARPLAVGGKWKLPPVGGSSVARAQRHGLRPRSCLLLRFIYAVRIAKA
jgi:hypothetical protein